MIEKQSSIKEGEKNIPRLDPLCDGISALELIRVSGSDLDIVNAARVSYGKVSQTLSERDKKLIKYLSDNEHTSPFEHNQLSFRVKAPLYIARQWMRHRMHSYNEVSYRYTKAPIEFYIPPHWRFQDATNRQCSSGSFTNEELLQAYKQSLEQSFQAYEKLLEQGVSREQARGLLPLCMYTEFIFTSNLHALMHFMKLRLHKGAQYEIRVYAKGMMELAQIYFPEAITCWRQKQKELEL